MSETGKDAKVIVAAWGGHGTFLQRANTVCAMLAKAGRTVGHLGLTKDGYPRHPLYLKKSAQVEPLNVGVA